VPALQARSRAGQGHRRVVGLRAAGEVLAGRALTASRSRCAGPLHNQLLVRAAAIVPPSRCHLSAGLSGSGCRRVRPMSSMQPLRRSLPSSPTPAIVSFVPAACFGFAGTPGTCRGQRLQPTPPVRSSITTTTLRRIRRCARPSRNATSSWNRRSPSTPPQSRRRSTFLGRRPAHHINGGPRPVITDEQQPLVLSPYAASRPAASGRTAAP